MDCFIIPQQNIYIDSQVLDYDFYYENVEVYINDLDVTQLLTVDDSNVMYQVKGSYDVIYQVVYDGKTFDSKITVHIKCPERKSCAYNLLRQ